MLATLLSTVLTAQLAWEGRRLAIALASLEPEPAVDVQASESTVTAALRATEARVAKGEALRNAVGNASDLPRNNAVRLAALISTLPDTLWLSEVLFTGKDGVRVSGFALDSRALAGFSKRLGGLPDFKGMPLHVLRLETEVVPASERIAYRFELSSVDATRANTP